ncbi:MAG TPA: serine/threonine-protein kinase [Kofleriaceae bacterium]|nr:serine/threonine-protein kinase [Kofleriaceae bacterium]
MADPPPGSADTVSADTVTDRGVVRIGPSGRAVLVRRDLPTIDRARYDLGDELARGGMGRIRAARDLHLDREVAIKEVLEPAGDAFVRFEREALVSARLQHPGIVAVYEAGRWPSGEPFYAMRLVHGRSLRAVISAATTLDARLALLPHIGAVADAMAYAHEHRIVHRDLKPANVLVGEFGETVVIDWGLAKDLAAGDDDSGAPATPGGSGEGVTRAGTVLGTPSYMPPEQARGESVGTRADVYALGAMLYHLLAGEPPYLGEDSQRVLATVASAPPRPLAERAPGAPRDLLAIAGRAMARDPAERYPSARGLADDLRRFLTGRLVASHHYTRGELVRRFVRRHRVPLAIAAAALVVIAVAGSYAIQRIRAERDQARAERARADEQHHLADLNADRMWMAQAARQVRTDPTGALLSLHAMSPGTIMLPEMRMIAADARAHGIPKLAGAPGHEVLALALAPDHAHAATAGGDHAVRLWSLDTMTSRVIGTHGDRVEDVAFSPDGTRIASVGLDQTARVWGIDGTAIATIRAPSELLHVAFSPDGAAIAAEAANATIAVWSVPDGAARATFHVPGNIARLAFDASGVVLACDVDGAVHRLELATGADRVLAATSSAFAFGGPAFAAATEHGLEVWDDASARPRVLDAPSGIEALAISGDGQTVAAYARPADQLFVWQHGERHRFASQRDDNVTALALAPDASAVAVISRMISVVDLATRDVHVMPQPQPAPPEHVAYAAGALLTSARAQLVRLPIPPPPRLVAPGRFVRQVAYRPDGSLVVIEPKRIGTIDLPAALVGRAVLARDGSAVVALGDDGVVRVIALPAGPVRALPGSVAVAPRTAPKDPAMTASHADGSTRWTIRRAARALREGVGWVDHVALSPDGRTVACADTTGGRVQVWSLAGGGPRALDVGAGDIEDLAFTRDGGTLVLGDSEGVVHLLEVATGRDRALAGHTAPIERVAISPTGLRVASAAADGTVRSWDLATGAVAATQPTFGVVDALAYAPDGAHLAFGRDGGDVEVRTDPPSSGFIWPRSGPGEVLELAYAPDGETLAVATSEGAQLALASGGPSRTLRANDAIGCLVFAPDGNHVAAVDREGVAREWSDDLPRDETALRAWIDRNDGQ